MNVVFDASNLHRYHLVFAGNAANVCPHPLFDFRLNEADAIFGAENNVVTQRGKVFAIGEAPVCSTVADATRHLLLALKQQSINELPKVNRPSGTMLQLSQLDAIALQVQKLG